MNREKKEKCIKRKGAVADNEEGKSTKKNKSDKDVACSDEESDEEREEGGVYIAGVYVPPAPPAVCSLENLGPRLIITHITIENFKSYLGKQVLGPFHKSFTSIIGPNGSGKSNVIDSMLFVFGYRATKIRSKKISVLIHKSQNFQNLKSCTVSVHFALINDMPGDAFEIIPKTEFNIARTAFSDNSSKYSVNGKTKTFKEVVTLLLSHGIDLKHNRFLILQGEVEEIAMMKPKAQTEHETGMLEYLEDIIGTVRYKKPIAKLAEKLEATVAEQQEKLNKHRMAEKDKASLVGPVREAISYLRKDNKRIINYNKLYQLILHQCKSDVGGKEKKKQAVDDQIHEIDNKLKELKGSTSSQEKELNGRIMELSTMNDQMAKLKELFNKSERRNTQLKEEISLHNKRKKKDIESKKQDEAKLVELSKIPEKNQSDIVDLEKVKAQLVIDMEREKENVKAVMASVSEQTKPLNEQQEILQNDLIGKKKIRDTFKESLNLAKTKLDLYVNNEKREEEKLRQIKDLIESSADKLIQRSREVAELEKKIPPCEKDILTVQVELQRLGKVENLAAREHNAIISELDDKKRSAQSNKSRNQVLQFIMKQKESGAIPGVIGRLGDLGGIDAIYDVAISTACGALDHIVVESVRTGKECVDALKQNDVGRANFIALEKVNWLQKEYSRPMSTPENVPRLFDLIQFSNERYKPAFYFALRDTLVAKDLEQAKRVAYSKQRFRVVTLDGEIIELAGTMSGGGNQKMRGRMGRNPTIVEVNPQVIEGLEKRAEELFSKLAEFGEQRIKLEDNLASKTRQLDAWKDQYQTYSLELKELKKSEGHNKNQLVVQEKKASETKADPEQVRVMEAKVLETTEGLNKATEDTDAIENQLKSINDEIGSLTGERVKTAQKKLDNLRKQMDKITKEIPKLNVAIKTSQRESKKAEDRIVGYTTEIQQTEEALLKCQAEMKKLINNAASIRDDNEELTVKMEESEKLIAEIRKGMTTHVKEEGKLKAEKIKLKQSLDSFVEEIHALNDKAHGLEVKIKNLVLHKNPFEDIDDESDDEQDVVTLQTYSENEITQFSYETLKYKGTCFDSELNNAKFNPQIIKDYQEKVALCEKRLSELEEVTERRNKVRMGHDDLIKARLNEFMVGFTIISNKLKEMYQMITFGGDAELDLADNLDPFSEGVFFSVRPPRKSWKIISNLSGGEKTLSSLALVFALHYYKPSPLYVMDEIDAALDFKNVSIVGHYIKERTKNTQFIIISLRSNMFELADVLVGIYKTFNATKCVTITPNTYMNGGQKTS